MRSTSQPLLQTSRRPGLREGASAAWNRRLRSLLTLLAGTLFVLALLLLAAAMLTRTDGGGGAAGGGAGAAAEGWGAEDTGQETWTVSGLEAAARELALGGGGGSQDESASLAAARKRALKAASLPPEQYRSHSAGMLLSPGAAEAAAGCRGERCDQLRSFVLAAQEAARLADSGGCAVQHCPDALGIGPRPLPYSSHAYGNRCEPLWTRGALEVVRQLVGRDWRGLEWLTGGSTTWLLTRLGHLTSIEGARGFADKAKAVAAAQFEQPFLDSHWALHLAPPAAQRLLTFGDVESPDVWRDYCAASFLPPGKQYELIAVQGFARVACLRRAVELLVPQGGLLVLPQAQRPAYAGAAALVPPHWLQLNDTHQLGTTLVWMSRAPG